MQFSIKPSQPHTTRVQTQNKEHVRTSTGTPARTNTRGEKQTEPNTTNKLFLTEKKSEPFHIKKTLFQIHSEANVARLLLKEKQTAKILPKTNREEKEEEEKEKGKRKKNIGSYEYAALPFSQAPWKEKRASS